MYEFAAIMALVRTRKRHLVPNFWQCVLGCKHSISQISFVMGDLMALKEKDDIDKLP